MDRKETISQLADIMVDWCEHDLGRVREGQPYETAREAVMCMLWTLTQDRTALDLFNRLLRQEIIDRNQERVSMDSGI